MSNNPTQKPVWQDLIAHKNEIDTIRIEELNAKDANRESAFSVTEGPIRYSFAKTKTNAKTIQLLTQLADDCGLSSWRERMISGEAINHTEGRPVLHMALRGSTPSDLEVDGENTEQFINGILEQMKTFTDTLRAEKRFTQIVNIGVGGSDAGPRLICQALKKYQDKSLDIHFLSTIDPAEAHELFEELDPKKTLFIVASKSFGTQETLTNFELAKNWMIANGFDECWSEHFVAVTSRADRAMDIGFEERCIFNMGEWVGGRFSLWSSIGLIIPIALGFENFKALLDGAHRADQHFMKADLDKNIPVLMAMLGIWHRNFFDFESTCVLPYNRNLRAIPTFVQQLEMESNGKRVDRQGDVITDYHTCPVVFGEVGTNAQHAFFQMLHQGTTITPCDFIVTQNALYDDAMKDKHSLLLSNVYGQMKALMVGDRNPDLPHKDFPGDRPSTLMMLDNLTPESVGMMLAFYEHKTFVQGVVWNLNSYDQWGVELGKKLALEALKDL